MSLLAFFFIVVSLVSFVAAQLILKRAMEVYDKDRFQEFPVCLKGYRWRCPDDDFVFSYAWTAAAIRP